MKAISPSKNLSLKLLTIILFSLTLVTCKKKEEVQEEKQPTASFTTDKSVYISGEVMTLTSTSENASKFRWTLPDGQTNNSSVVSYSIPESPVDLTLPVKLEVFSESGNKTDYVVKNIQAKAADGKVTLYIQNIQSALGSNISVDGKSTTDRITTLSSVAPECASSGNPTYTLTVGTHVFMIQYSYYNGLSWIQQSLTETVTIKKGDCLVVRMDG